MLNYFLKKINNRKGFTLVELVVVISILGILAAIAVPKFTESTQQAKEAADKANKRTLTGAAAMYIASKGLPGEALEWKGTESGNEGWEGYLQEWPENPLGTGDYVVTISDEGEIEITLASPDDNGNGNGDG